MKKSLIRLVIIMLSVSLIATFSLIGCKETVVEETTAEETVAEETTAEETVAEETTAEEEVKELSGVLKVMSYWPGSAVLPDLAERFMEDYPNVQVEIITEFQDLDYVTAVTTVLNTDEKPDIFQFNPQYAKLVTMMEMGGLAPIDDVMEDINYSEVAPDAYELGKLGTDNSWNLTWQFSPTLLWYSSKAFENAGIEKAPETWQELLDTCAKLESDGIAPIVLSGADSWTSSQLFIPLLFGSMSVADVDSLFNGELSWGDEKVKAALKNINDLAKYIDPEAASVKFGDISLLLSNADGAMNVMLSGVAGTFMALEMEPVVDFNGITIPPANPELEPILYNAASGFCLVNDAPNMEAAKEFLKYCATAEWQEYMVNEPSTGIVLGALKEGINYEKPLASSIIERFSTVKRIGIHEPHISVQADFYNLMMSKLFGNVTDEDFIEQMDTIFTESVAAYNE